jgi:sortase B
VGWKKKAATLIQVSAGIVLAFCIYKITPKLLEYKASDDMYNSIKKEAVKELEPIQTPEEAEDLPDDLDKAITIDWESFKDMEVVAWLQLDDISYPVMQAEDNEAYLHHLPDGTYNYGGSLFLYNLNSPDFTDESSFIYGHNMANGSMFGTLKKYADDSYRNYCFYIYLPNGNRLRYRFFSVISVQYNDPAYEWSFSSKETFLTWQERLKSLSIYDNSPEVSDTASYVTLSTCNGYAGTSNRLLVTGQLERTDKLQEPASWYEEP